MKCYACDHDLSDKEINFDFEKANGLDLCTTCLDIALEAAYGSDRGLDEGQNIDPSFDEWESPRIDVV